MRRIPTFRPTSNGLAVVATCALLFGTSGCQSLSRWWNPASGYEAVGDPQLQFDEARAICERDAEFTSSGGTAHVDWNKFERCMKPKGWVRS